MRGIITDEAALWRNRVVEARTAALGEAAAVCRERAMLHRRAFSEAPARAMERLAGREEEATNCANLIERLIDAGAGVEGRSQPKAVRTGADSAPAICPRCGCAHLPLPCDGFDIIELICGTYIGIDQSHLHRLRAAVCERMRRVIERAAQIDEWYPNEESTDRIRAMLSEARPWETQP